MFESVFLPDVPESTQKVSISSFYVEVSSRNFLHNNFFILFFSMKKAISHGYMHVHKNGGLLLPKQQQSSFHYFPPFFIGRISQRWLGRFFLKFSEMVENGKMSKCLLQFFKMYFLASVSCPDSLVHSRTHKL